LFSEPAPEKKRKPRAARQFFLTVNKKITLPTAEKISPAYTAQMKNKY